MSSAIPNSVSEWRAALDALPSAPDNIPAFFFAHGSPMLALSAPSGVSHRGGFESYQGPNGPLASFLKIFGPTLLEKYKPKGIVVFSAHWETLGERVVTDYGSQNPLLMDYYGFPDEAYQLKFESKGDKALSERVVQLYKDAGYLARTTSKLEPRGEDGRGFAGPGLDHGVFVPFRLMFGEDFKDVPIVQVSIDSSMSPDGNWKIGRAVAALRKEGILVLSGGLPIHNLRDFSSFHPDTAKPVLHDFHKAILDAVSKATPEERKTAMTALTKHAGFRLANPREEHFVSLYVAAGAAEDGQVKVLNGLYGIPTVAFGV
ncbi:aromatic ring-opening dioxygenase [Moniliophthora roreri MCA 2997]|uniref:Aromatic ring-opening dioxygenase n=2 Tax=Moniliophthora roreri TaxID=221103 RepID=V2WTH9_MONRO|nr:aromatic ring-opening dioxygenase [Moniliophthora roreri MCA 2997]